MSNISTERSGQSANLSAVPHSWDLSAWDKCAPTVWPNTKARAAWIVRSYRKELLAHGAVVRVGKRLVILGRGYAKFLEKHIAHVEGFQSNNPLIGTGTSETSARE